MIRSHGLCAQLEPMTDQNMEMRVFLLLCSLEQLMQRVQTTAAHVILLGLSTLPCTLLHYFYFDGINKFGYIGMDWYFL